MYTCINVYACVYVCVYALQNFCFFFNKLAKLNLKIGSLCKLLDVFCVSTILRACANLMDDSWSAMFVYLQQPRGRDAI